VFVEKRARKKKGLTDPVQILPFKGQNLRNQAPKPVIKPSTEVRPSFSQEAPKPKVLKEPSGKLNTGNLSIHQISKDYAEKNIKIAPEDLPRESFPYDKLKMYWRQYAFKAKENTQETLYNSMIKREPILVDGKKIRIELDNPIQLGFVEAVQQELTTFLRESLKNYDIILEPFVSENQEEEQKYLSPKDQFSAMARTHPNLHTFKKLFNLDFDY
jgi:hypothetical protein